MLDNITRKRIDDARDVLVGKLPDPKSQVEQITVALIYKFMNDMDREFEDLGGEAEFFTGEYEDYKWSNIVSKKKSGFEKLNLYAEALEKLNLNNNLPALFRNIFKNVFLPYRDPETFNLFIKEIDGFSYEHSEDLGDAFEYLLSIMSSQGDAGQFRTPRHIIDFIVSIVQPKKNETILDPACGTAGFLISAYKYIIKENEEKGLTPDEKARLTENIVGYDISPDMVRLSLVNLYLHLFPNPKIYEYDTLTNDTRWNDTFDVILANPPFMTPKGGIRPHDQFLIQAKRSEVLFVDYIMEHLNINGRAGVIVPEGIIFQTAKAYKNLRKNLVENDYLWAVVSLPAGVFNPYSGVKTSILLMDREIAKKTDNILFIKIDNDGYDLGAQRRQVEGSDLPRVLALLNEYKQKIYMGETFELNENEDEFAVLAGKEHIKEQDYILVGDRYREKEVQHYKYPVVKINSIINNVKYPEKLLKSQFLDEGKYPIIDQSEKFIAGYSNDEKLLFRLNKPVICFGDHTRAIKYIDFDFILGADGVKILEPIDRINTKYLYYALRSIEIPSLGYSRHFKVLKEIEIPLPPLSIQDEIVADIELKEEKINELEKQIEQIRNDIKDKITEAWGE